MPGNLDSYQLIFVQKAQAIFAMHGKPVVGKDERRTSNIQVSEDSDIEHRMKNKYQL